MTTLKFFKDGQVLRTIKIHIGTAVQKSKDACCQPTALSLAWILQYYVLHVCKKMGMYVVLHMKQSEVVWCIEEEIK